MLSSPDAPDPPLPSPPMLWGCCFTLAGAGSSVVWRLLRRVATGRASGGVPLFDQVASFSGAGFGVAFSATVSARVAAVAAAAPQSCCRAAKALIAESPSAQHTRNLKKTEERNVERSLFKIHTDWRRRATSTTSTTRIPIHLQLPPLVRNHLSLPLFLSLSQPHCNFRLPTRTRNLQLFPKKYPPALQKNNCNRLLNPKPANPHSKFGSSHHSRTWAACPTDLVRHFFLSKVCFSFCLVCFSQSLFVWRPLLSARPPPAAPTRCTSPLCCHCAFARCRGRVCGAKPIANF